MSELMKELESVSRPRNTVEAALSKLRVSDQDALMGALRDATVSQVELARILTKHSGVPVSHKQLSDYKRKVQA